MFLFKSEIMDMKEEMMNDAIDDVIGDEEDDEERLVFFFCLKNKRSFVSCPEPLYQNKAHSFLRKISSQTRLISTLLKTLHKDSL